MNTRHDNSDAVRLLAALAVFVSHQLFLTTGALIPVSSFHDLGWGGVLVFFALSGYLVAGSWERDPHIGRFLIRRVLRIWPGLTVVTLTLTFVVGPLFTSLPLTDYLSNPQTARFLGHLVLAPTNLLPSVFLGNPIQKVDGPLWTLPIECAWYGLLAVAGATVLRTWKHAMVLIWLGCAVWLFFVIDVEAPEAPRRFFLEFGLMFIGGAVLSQYRDVWAARRWQTTMVLTAVALIAKAAGHEYLAIAVLLPWAVVFIATASTLGLRDAGRYGDLSYGIYIYGFPLQQIVIAMLGNDTSVLLSGAIALPVTLILSWLSWHAVEKPMLRFKRQLATASAGEREALK
jgi:peptidoglycan/LPS O-acetylase OafA/YrhL